MVFDNFEMNYKTAAIVCENFYIFALSVQKRKP
jgi:hypothetical protein